MKDECKTATVDDVNAFLVQQGWRGLNSILEHLAEARATVRFHKRLLPGRGWVVSAVVDGTEYEGPTAAEALLSWARRKAAA